MTSKLSYSIATLDIIHLNYVDGFHQIQSNIYGGNMYMYIDKSTYNEDEDLFPMW